MTIKCKKCDEIFEGDRKGTLFWCSCQSAGIDDIIWYTRLVSNKKEFEIIEENEE
jgi:hypothetical protein